MLISFIMVLSLVSVMPMTNVKAEEVNEVEVTEVDLTELNGLSGEFTAEAIKEGETWAVGTHEIKIQLPEEYNSFNELYNARLTNLQVELSVQQYSGGSAGFQLFSYSKDRNGNAVWDNGKDHGREAWYYLNSLGNTKTTTYNFSPNFSNNLLYLGVQFAKLTPGSTIKYTINSVKLVKDDMKWNGYDTTPVLNTVKGDYDPKPNYAKLLQESLYFFDMNMCGSDVDKNTGVLWRENCHINDQTTYAGQNVDVSGGYHDAGDHVKFGLPQAYSASMLGMIYREYKDDFKKLGQDKHIELHLNRFADYFKSCTVMDEFGNVVGFCYQVGDGEKDHKYWGAPEEQEKEQGDRASDILFTSDDNPCTDIVAETAAALAIHSVIFNNSESLTYAKALLAYAEKPEVKKCASTDGFYDGKSYQDDLALASYWIFIATKDFDYRTKYINYMSDDIAEQAKWSELSAGNVCWDNVCAATMLALDYSTLDSLIENGISNNSPNRYAYITNDNYGTARYNTTLQYIALALDKHRRSNVYGAWATGQMNYLLGNNSAGYCYVIGYNKLSVKYPHHRAASGYTVEVQPETMPKHLMLGTLVGGPKNDDSFVDKADICKTNEPALDYQVGLVGAAVALYHIHKNDENADTRLHSKAYLKSVEISKYYLNENVDPSHEHNAKHYEAKEATCTEPGNVEYWYCDRCEDYFLDENFEKMVAKDETVISIDENKHDFGKVSYTWADDYSTVTAKRVCKNNPKHVETETVKTKYEVVTEETEDSDGVGKYNSEAFENENFEVQSKEVKIPAKDKKENNLNNQQQNNDQQKDGDKQTNPDKQKDDDKQTNPDKQTDDGQKTNNDKQKDDGQKTNNDKQTNPDTKTDNGQKTDDNQTAKDGTKVGPGASATVADKAITTCNSDEGPKGSEFGLLKAKMKKVKKDSITISWQKVKGAKYVVYGNLCGKKKKFEKIATVKSNKFTHKKLKKGSYYKYLIVALKNNKVISTSKTIHIATKGGKVTNSSKVKLNKTSVKLKKNKTFKLKAKLVNPSKKLKVKKHRKVMYESSNTSVATVDKKGKIKAKGKGTAYIYAYAQDGVFAKIKVKVK